MTKRKKQIWTPDQISDHTLAAEALGKIKDRAFEFISERPGVSEYEVQQFILDQYKDLGLVSEWETPIVAFGENSGQPHYFPKKKSKKLKKLSEETLIMVDIWARFDKKKAPFADTTFMGYYGKSVPENINDTFKAVIGARDKALDYMREELKRGNLPMGRDIDIVSRAVLLESGEGRYLDAKYGLGHDLGIKSPHGNEKNWIGIENDRRLLTQLGYTLEPALYLKGKYGIRSEIDFYVTSGLELVVTSDVQKEIIMIN